MSLGAISQNQHFRSLAKRASSEALDVLPQFQAVLDQNVRTCQQADDKRLRRRVKHWQEQYSHKVILWARVVGRKTLASGYVSSFLLSNADNLPVVPTCGTGRALRSFVNATYEEKYGQNAHILFAGSLDYASQLVELAQD